MTPIMKKEEVQSHFDGIASEYDYWKKKNAYYHSTIKAFLGKIIPKESHVLEIGCGTGEILAYLRPSQDNLIL